MIRFVYVFRRVTTYVSNSVGERRSFFRRLEPFLDDPKRAMERGDSLAADLARQDFEREASERYKDFVVRSRLKRVPNEAVKCDVFARKEEVRRIPPRYIEFVKSPDGHFRDRFACCPDLPVQEFRSYSADFLCLQEAEAASCEGLVTECEVRDALKQVGLNKSPDGLP